jgi:hypothetical protein
MERQYDVDNDFEYAIMIPEEVARYLHKSLSWVYKNWQLLGGRKLRGSLFFPRKEDLYERLFGKGEGVEVRFHSQRDQVHKHLVRNKKQGEASGSKKKGGDTQPKTGEGDPNRHGLLGTGQQAVGSCESV